MKFDIAKNAAPAPAPVVPAAPLVVTASAAARIAIVLKDEGETAMMRVAVEGGGCSGFQYKFAVVHAVQPDDTVIEKDGIQVLVDSASAPLLAGSALDYVSELLGASFKVVNPNATASCGCGTSFSL
jgi:iron-sulfur cluster assembly accessory protein